MYRMPSTVKTNPTSNMTPDYEVKFLLDSALVLGSDHKLMDCVLSAFNMPDKVTKINVQFLDTDEKDINNAGWSCRIRKKEDGDDFELTYKKRYPIASGEIDTALTVANSEGFDDSEDKYEAQVEWGYQNQTLSISRKKKASDGGFSALELPAMKDAREMLIDNTPGKFEDWLQKDWGKDALKLSRVYGPVRAKRWDGVWSGVEVSIEVWPIRGAAGTGMEYIVEASFKADNHTTALTKRDDLMSFLQERGWFVARDGLKTSLIMERY